MASFSVNKTTSTLLKNFSGISDSILLSPGTTQKTVAAGKSLLAIAEFPEAWPRETGIYSLSTFLSMLSLFQSPTVDFRDDLMVLQEGRERVKYRYSDPSTILSIAPSKSLSKDNPGVQFTLPAEALQRLKKAAALAKVEDITIEASGGGVIVRATDVKNGASHAYEYSAEDVKQHDDKFAQSQNFNVNHIGMLLDGKYEVSLGPWKWAHFKHTTEPISYFVVAGA
jgi:hypothetical protein